MQRLKTNSELEQIFHHYVLGALEASVLLAVVNVCNHNSANSGSRSQLAAVGARQVCACCGGSLPGRLCTLLRVWCATRTSNIGEKPVTTTGLASYPFIVSLYQGCPKLSIIIYVIGAGVWHWALQHAVTQNLNKECKLTCIDFSHAPQIGLLLVSMYDVCYIFLLFFPRTILRMIIILVT